MRKKILIADASDTIIAVCRKLFSQHGHDAVLFQDGTKALEELKRSEFDLAILSTTTQNADGYFIVKEIRKDRVKSKLPVLMLLGSSELLDTKELLEAAPDDTLSKPFSPQELLLKAEKLLKLPSKAPETEGEFDVESILEGDPNSFDRKISNATDKIFVGVLQQSITDTPKGDKPRLDKIDLSENQYDVSGHTPPPKPEGGSAHDYDWFVNEMKQEDSGGATPEPAIQRPSVPSGISGKFQVEEIGTSKFTLNALRKMQSAEEEEKTKIYIEKLHEPLAADRAFAEEAQRAGKATDFRSQFVKFFAEALAKELVQNTDFQKLALKIDELFSLKQEKS